jgi:hypothetical protein
MYTISYTLRAWILTHLIRAMIKVECYIIPNISQQAYQCGLPRGILAENLAWWVVLWGPPGEQYRIGIPCVWEGYIEHF